MGKNKYWKKRQSILYPAFFIALLFFFWELSVRSFNLPEYILPLPSGIAKAFLLNIDLLFYHSRYTLLAALSGLFLGIILALLIAYAMNKWSFLKKLLYPLLVISQTIPIIALAPVIMIWFGLGLWPKILTVTLVSFFPLTVSVSQGLEEAPQKEMDLLKVMGASHWQIIRHIKIPFALPYFFSGLKISVTYSIMGAVIGEWLGGNKGLGVYMIRSMQTFKTSNLFAAIFLVVFISLILFKITEYLSLAFMPWEKIKGGISSDENE